MAISKKPLMPYWLKSLDKEVVAIASRYNRLRRKEGSGILSFEQSNITENQIVEHLIHVINHPEDELYPVEKSIYTSSATWAVVWKYNIAKSKVTIMITTIMIVILLGLVEVFNVINIISKDLQLTVFVTDVQGNVALELEGELNIALGDRSLNKAIGEDGRTNFADITRKNKGDTIQVGLKAEGWEIVGENTFTCTGGPISIQVRRDNSLGTIKGVVKSRDGQQFIEGALVRINTDTTVVTDRLGIFKIILPEKMRVKKETDGYLLTISKTGYKTKTKCYFPGSSDAEIRLEKE